MSHEHVARTDTSFASPGRAEAAQLCLQRDAFLSEPIAMELLDAMSGPAMVLNSQRQIVVANRPLLEAFGVRDGEALFGLRPGEVVECVHSREHTAGCGTSRACAHCGVVRAVLDCLVSGRRVVREASIRTGRQADGGMLDVRVHATHVSVGGEGFVVAALEDISSEKRRLELEQAFFHELHDTCSGLRGLAELLSGPWQDAQHELEYKAGLRTLSVLAVEQIEAQRQLLAAERDELGVFPVDVDVAALLSEVAALQQHHPLARGREVRLESPRRCRVHTDPALLRHVAGHLIRSALAATAPGGTVSVSCESEQNVATLSIHHDGVASEAERVRIFQRSVPAAEGPARGMGTYGARLLAERYLRGSVEFVSNDRLGTLFVVVLPDLLEKPARG